LEVGTSATNSVGPERIRTSYNSSMIAADIFRPERWSDFFLLVGTGAVTLTGLVFVAMSLNLKEIAFVATHRYRAINTLTGLALVFMRCALVLMGAQDHRSIGAELFVVAGISAAVFIKGYARAIRMGNGLRITRIVGGSSIHLAEMIGAALFFFGHLFGLYIAAIAIVTNTCYMITAAWLLVMGAFDQKTA
jgi:modulator of FtsH protease